MPGTEVDASGGVRYAPPRVSERAEGRRTPDERFVVRFPWAFRQMAVVLQLLPPRSRLRRAMLGRGMARAYAAANRRDFELILTLHDPERYEYRPSRALLPPDMEPAYHGPDGYRRFWRLWLDAFEDIRWDAEEIVDFGEKVLITARQSGSGAGSGVAVSEPWFQLYTFRRGLVIRQEDFVDRDEAMRAATARD